MNAIHTQLASHASSAKVNISVSLSLTREATARHRRAVGEGTNRQGEENTMNRNEDLLEVRPTRRPTSSFAAAVGRSVGRPALYLHRGEKGRSGSEPTDLEAADGRWVLMRYRI